MRASSSPSSTVTTPASSLWTISENSRAGTTALPLPSPSAGACTRIVSSRSEPTSSTDPSVSVTRRPESTGIAPARDATARCAVAIASASVSRSHRNFTRPPTKSYKLLVVVVVEPVDWGRSAILAAQPRDRRPPVLHSSPHPYGVITRRPPVVPRDPGPYPQGSTALSTAAEPDTTDQLVHLLEDVVPFGHLLLDLVDGVHHGGVVAPSEHLGDTRV